MSKVNKPLLPRPFIKWVGGKKSTLATILAHMPRRIETYYEPFFGGGAVFFALARAKRFKRAVIADTNSELITTLLALRDELNSVTVAMLCMKSDRVDEDTYNSIRREKFTDPAWAAARMIFLNKTCFNGLYRVNRSGEFNSPWGKHTRFVPDLENLQAVSDALQGAEIKRYSFASTVDDAELGDVVYFDPPYFPVSKTASFTAYTRSGFSLADQLSLASTFAELAKRRVTTLASNADVPAARALYGSIPGVEIVSTKAPRSVNSDGSKRGRVGELLIVANRRK